MVILLLSIHISVDLQKAKKTHYHDYFLFCSSEKFWFKCRNSAGFKEILMFL